MKTLLCIAKGNGHLGGLPNPEMGIIYKAKGPIVDPLKRARYGNKVSNKWYILDKWNRFQFSELLFEELSEDFLENLNTNQILIPQEMNIDKELVLS